MGNDSLFVSIVICTFQRPFFLDKVLKSLLLQDHDEPNWEVVVVENDTKPSIEVKQVLDRYSTKLPLIKAFQGELGLSRSRNLGAKIARGDYIVYLDDDVEVKPTWLNAVIQGCRKYLPDFAGGPIFPFYTLQRPHWFRDSYFTLSYFGNAPCWLGRDDLLSGGNFIVNRELLLRLGGFREDLGMLGDKLWWSEETELLKRAWDAIPGLKVRYFPEAAVLHNIRPEKLTLQWRYRALYTNALCVILWRNISVTGPVLIKGLFSVSYHLIKNTPGLLFTLFLDIFRPKKALWKRYVQDHMLSHIARIAALFHQYRLQIKHNGLS